MAIPHVTSGCTASRSSAIVVNATPTAGTQPGVVVEGAAPAAALNSERRSVDVDMTVTSGDVRRQVADTHGRTAITAHPTVL